MTVFQLFCVMPCVFKRLIQDGGDPGLIHTSAEVLKPASLVRMPKHPGRRVGRERLSVFPV